MKQFRKAAIGWTLERMSKVDLSILRNATYEILFDRNIPKAVAINEAVELAKIYCDEGSPRFINGCLGQNCEFCGKMMSCGSKKRIFLGIDTSCYTTSAACVCVNENSAEIVCDERTLLKVAAGERGLRQSDAVFQHVRNLAEILPKIFKQIDRKDVAGVGVSVCPSGRKGSYMPVFLAGKSHALSVSAALGVPVYEFTHQQGHIRAAAFDNESLLGKDFFAFHLSGGTSELLRIDSSLSDIKKIGGTTDINAGQLVDRLGVAMGLRFPAGKELEKIAAEALKNKSYADSGFVLPSSVKSLSCSFSGVETKAANALKNGEKHGTVAAAVYDCIARTLAKLVKKCN